jgi:hypothetical protein
MFEEESKTKNLKFEEKKTRRGMKTGLGENRREKKRERKKKREEKNTRRKKRRKKLGEEKNHFELSNLPRVCRSEFGFLDVDDPLTV